MHFNNKGQVFLFTLIVAHYSAICTLYMYIIGNQLETPTSCLSQAFGMDYGGVSRKRKAHFRFTEYQLSELRKRFKSDPHLTGIEKELIAKNLGTTQSSVNSWFKSESLRLK